MRKFLIQSVLFLFTVLSLFLIILARADGHSDPFYLRFTTPKQENLILGTSRSAQGLMPYFFNKRFDKKFYNFSFTVADSPYGLVYLNAIKKKLHKNKNKKSIFILNVDPWSISSSIDNPNDISKFSENIGCLANMFSFNTNPNIEYVFKNMSGKYYKLVFKEKSEVLLHDDGWLEVSVPMDSVNEHKRLRNKIKEYKENRASKTSFSSVRLFYLEKTIKFLKNYGKVYLVRLPIHKEILKIEDLFMPNFNEVISSAVRISDGYLDMTSNCDNYRYTDGNHIYKKSSAIVSKEVANWIYSEKQ